MGVLASSGLQADLVYQAVRKQLLLHPDIKSSDFAIQKDTIKNLKNHSSIEKLYSNANTLLGRHFDALVCDELGAMQDDSCYRACTSGMAFARGGGTILAASNPPSEPTAWVMDFVAERKKDPKWEVMEFSASPKTDPFSSSALEQSNPIFKAYVSNKRKNKHLKPVHDFLMSEMKEGEKSPQAGLSFLRYQLGRRIINRESEFINPADIKVSKLTDVLSLPGCRVSLGLDIALSQDICACCIGFHYKDEMHIWPVMHVADVLWRTSKQQAWFREQHNLGYLTIQGRKSLDKQSFLTEIKDFIRLHRITPRGVYWDKGLASSTWEDSLKYGKTELIAGTAHNLASPIREMQAKARSGKLFLIGENKAVRKFFGMLFVPRAQRDMSWFREKQTGIQ